MEPNPSLVSKNIQDDLAKLGSRINHASHFYDLMLESCEKLFDNELEQASFEEMMRFMFGVKVYARVACTRMLADLVCSTDSRCSQWTRSLAR